KPRRGIAGPCCPAATAGKCQSAASRAPMPWPCALEPTLARVGPTHRLQRFSQALLWPGQVQRHYALFASERLSPSARDGGRPWLWLLLVEGGGAAPRRRGPGVFRSVLEFRQELVEVAFLAAPAGLVPDLLALLVGGESGQVDGLLDQVEQLVPFTV